ncbi:MAG: aminotransferase class I/II-fold pyridoxal phosphate-dependent enzyme [Candidatus Eisenbacteria bacterium]|uniref:Aminotransferase n=1 Tax=Eiseniibacteriota bacterium TaxID=2212470 RepID=A0A9D6LC47_UNCEI|nr:aminotransferase class I/II-fold pyridoxal phosphate-dependent enzyme [Candidatus Eisenbacteria bacterium]MBI3540393.1 aminotransferase class I/II-fold pyridoxal phosphate-dependent enzyme [Candidatus Eisenbacteria bacterium]
MRPLVSQRSTRFTESVIREMTRLCHQHGGVNLAQGFPDFAAPEAIKDEAARAVRDDVNQYAITWGAKRLRDALVEKTLRFAGLRYDAETEITVCCGSTECMIATMLGLVNPGEEVVIFEPFYENYGPDVILSGATPRFVRLREPDWTYDPAELEAAFSNRTKAIVINTPNNPTGKVFSRAELEHIAALCRTWDVVAITDEIYEHILYDGAEHVSMASLDGMRERTVTISGVSKTYSVTGWRIGWCLAAPPLTAAIRKVHDFLTVGAPAPLQEAAAVALATPDGYYRTLADGYRERRDHLVPALEAAGFRAFRPRGAYYVMTDISGFGFPDDVAFARHLVADGGVAAVPGSSFYSDPAAGRQRLRFHFARRRETLDAAVARLGRLKARASVT